MGWWMGNARLGSATRVLAVSIRILYKSRARTEVRPLQIMFGSAKSLPSRGGFKHRVRLDSGAGLHALNQKIKVGTGNVRILT